jgi:uncharacterized protein (DUF736 family)
MNIGTFKKNEDGFVGSISTFGGQFKKVVFEAISREGNGPDYIVHADGGELGAAWNKTSEKKGTEYISVSFKGPFLAAPVYASLVESTKAPGTFSLLWSEKKNEKPAA